MEQDLIKKGRLLALKIFAESYLISKGKGESAEGLFANRELNDETTITGEESLLLHNWLMADYRGMGLDLNKIIEASGQASEHKKLSEYEIHELVRRADMMLIQISVLEKYVNKNKGE